jgi:hypothetical protein
MTSPVATIRPAGPPHLADRPEPWWRHGMLWLVIATPMVAVVASVAVAVLAWEGGAAELAPLAGTSPARHQAGADPPAKTPTAPALQARNHAATPRR